MSDDSDRRGLLPAPGPGEYWGSDHLAQAGTLYERGDFKRAFSLAVKAIDSWPTNWLPYLVAGDCLSRLESDEIDRLTDMYKDEWTAEGYYRSALLHEPPDGARANILHKLGEIYGEQGGHGRAVLQYEEAVICQPD